VKQIQSNNITLNTEHFGDSKNPAVLLIMGATAQGLMWDELFCKALANLELFVIRYDHRDTGRSSRIDYNKNPYTLYDLKEDAIAVLDGYGVKKAHFVAASMGSFIAQKVAIDNPDRILSLTCIMSSPNHQIFVDGFLGNDISHHPLPASNPKIMEYYQELLSINPKTVEESDKLHTEAWKKVAGHEEHLHIRMFEGKILKRLKNHKYIHNHSFALANSPDLYNDLNKISVPTLVIHGEEDYVLPFEHGQHLAEMIKGSKFIAYKHMGHCFSEAIYRHLLIDLRNHFFNVSSL
jgi:pimeloyl-ACP methyl ester carboxylesterase